MSGQPHILVVDDYRDIRDLLARFLEKHGCRVTVADGGTMLRKAIRESAIDIVVLDIMMPGEDGLSLCRWLRENSALPVILLTAVAEETDRIVGLEMGADDYVTKPFNPRELLARVKAVLRRASSLPPNREPVGVGRARFGSWTLDRSRREVVGADGVAVPLSTGEFRLLGAFLAHPRMVLSRDQLLDQTRGRRAEAFDRAIDNQISRLRKKIEPNPADPQLIKTVWGGGYLFAADVEDGQ